MTVGMAGDHLTPTPAIATIAPAVAMATTPATAAAVLANELGTTALGNPDTIARLSPGLAFHARRARQLADHPGTAFQAAFIAAVLDRFAAYDAAAITTAVAIVVITVTIALRLRAARGRQHWQQGAGQGAPGECLAHRDLRMNTMAQASRIRGAAHRGAPHGGFFPIQTTQPWLTAPQPVVSTSDVECVHRIAERLDPYRAALAGTAVVLQGPRRSDIESLGAPCITGGVMRLRIQYGPVPGVALNGNDHWKTPAE
ncbi:exported protein of unknown function [Stenotrophomonas maltophilia]|nr:exported protein of unknown function [Stenotrophomonas maltophilia]